MSVLRKLDEIMEETTALHERVNRTRDELMADIRARHDRMERIERTQNPGIMAEKGSESYRDRKALLGALEASEMEVLALRDLLEEAEGNCRFHVEEEVKLRVEVRDLVSRVRRLEAGLDEAKAELRESRDRETALLMEKGDG